MPLPVFEDSCDFRLSKTLIRILNAEIEKSNCPLTQGVILTFRDEKYSPERGGYHPVEIFITRQGIIKYVTDFAYIGCGPYAEMVKEIDFDFGHKVFGHMGQDYPLEEGRGLFVSLFQKNFCSYYQDGVYTVSAEPL